MALISQFVRLEVMEPVRSIVFNFSPAPKISHLCLKNTATDKAQSYRVPVPVDAQLNEHTPDVIDEALSVADLDTNADRVLVDGTQQRITISVPESWNLSKGTKLALYASWTAELTDSMVGYYKSSWKKDGKDRHYALTQFQATYARLAFPCWDEPDLKCTYTIAMVSRKGLTNLSNMPAFEEKDWTGSIELNGNVIGDRLSESSSEDWIVTRFQTTPLISSYLVAWANGEFDHLDSAYISPLSGRTVPLRIYATSDCIHQAQLALDVKAKVMSLYEQIFGIEYTLPELDTLVASSFESGAMENWGLITGRTTAFLWDAETSSLKAKKTLICTQSHECAHMWFGNVVSPKWWTYLWLNEAFATLMGSAIIPDRVFPALNLRQEFLTGHFARALGLDSVRSSHPIEVDCPDAARIGQIFDAVSYSKGASILRMLTAMVGEDTFLRGVSIYLQQRLFANATTEDLWAGIAEASGVHVAKVMKEWVRKIGFPVIEVIESGDTIKVRQSRFLSTGDVKPEEDETIWYVPLELKTIDKNGRVSIDHGAILHEREANLNGVNVARCFKLNAETVGFYRVAYSPERLWKLGEEAAKQAGGLTAEDRIGLVSDAMTLARAGHSKTSGGLNLISKLSNEPELGVWNSIATGLAKLKGVWWEEPEEVRTAIDRFRVQVFRPLADRLDWQFEKGEDPVKTELRALAIATLAGAEDPETISEIQKRFQPFLQSSDATRIPADVQRTIFVIAVRYGGEDEYQKARELYYNPPNPVAKIDALYALAASKKQSLRQKTFEMITDGSVLDQDLM